MHPLGGDWTTHHQTSHAPSLSLRPRNTSKTGVSAGVYIVNYDEITPQQLTKLPQTGVISSNMHHVIRKLWNVKICYYLGKCFSDPDEVTPFDGNLQFYLNTWKVVGACFRGNSTWGIRICKNRFRKIHRYEATLKKPRKTRLPMTKKNKRKRTSVRSGSGPWFRRSQCAGRRSTLGCAKSVAVANFNFLNKIFFILDFTKKFRNWYVGQILKIPFGSAG